MFVLSLALLPLKNVFADTCSDPMGSIYECSGEVTYDTPSAPRASAPQAPVKSNYNAPVRQPVYKPAANKARKQAPAAQSGPEATPGYQEAQGPPVPGCPEGSSMGPNGCYDDGSFTKNPEQKPTDKTPECMGHFEGLGAHEHCVADDPSAVQDAGKNVVKTNDCPEGTGAGPDGKCQPDGSYDKSPPKPIDKAAADVCKSAASTATSLCKGTMAAYATQINGLNNLMSSFQGGNRAEACTVAANVSKKQAILSGVMAASCQIAMGRCTSACVITNPDDPNADEWAKKSAECDSYQNYVYKNGLAAAQQLATAKASSDCADQVTAAAIPTPPPLSPILPIAPQVGMLDCGNTAFSNANPLKCYCQSNASDPKCANGSSGAGGSGSHSARSGDNSGGGAGLSIPETAGSGNPTVGAPIGSTAANNGGGSSGSGGGGAFGGPSGGGGVAAAGVAEDGAPPGGAPNGGSIFGGFGSGQGGFSYGRGGAGAGEGGGNAASRMFKSLAAKLNLNKIMPKRNDYLNRSVAGMSGTSRDGITGPNGPSIWEKVSRRYQIKKGEMLPP